MHVATGDDGYVKFPQQFLLAFGEIHRGLHQDPAKEIADDAATHRFNALAANPEHLAGLGAGRNPEHHLAVEGWHLHLAAAVSYTHLRAHVTVLDLVCRLLLEKKTTLSPYVV